MGGYPPSEEVSITNGLWRLIEANNIPFSVAKVFADEKEGFKPKTLLYKQAYS